jgi:histidinol dehydrogenase
MKIYDKKSSIEAFFDAFFSKQQVNVIESVKEIVNTVKEQGDAAVLQYTQQFDNENLSQLRVTQQEIDNAYQAVNPKVVESIKIAAQRIETFAKKQFEFFKDFSYEDEFAELGQRIVPLDSVGCYIPGGRFPLFSTVLMSVIPAKVAGVKDIIMCSPKIQPITLVAADLSGASQVFRIGGAQAISAMAYGTESIPKVCKIVGPGNQYVQNAKKLVFGEVGIDFIAGPSEVLVIADETGNPEFIAADLLAQAEHDPNAIANLFTTSKTLALKVNDALMKQLPNLTTQSIATLALRNGGIFILDTMEEIISYSNRIAPEHLEIQITNPETIIPDLRNYGSLFIGPYSAEVFGDYCSGTNHILPTNGVARYSGGLSVKDFIKILTYQKIRPENRHTLIKLAANMAQEEGLHGHQKAAEYRLE